MPRNTYGYDTYHGRSAGAKFLTGLIVVLLIVLALAVAAFFFLQRYMVYTDDGQARLELPFFQQRAQETPAPAPTASQDVVIITTAPTPAPEPTPTVEVLPVTNALWLLRAHLTEGSWRGELTKAGADAVLFNLKADDGTLGYVSALPEAIRLGSSAADGKLNTALTGLSETGVYTIARVSCFKDNTAPKMDNTLAIRTNSNYNWRDASDLRWMNVSSPAARQYVVDVIRELAAMGFDEILLENSGYPTAGILEYIKVGEAYDPDNLSAPVEEFYQAVTEALSGTGVRLSISTSAQVMTGEGDVSGQTAELLGKYADRIYVPAPAEGQDYGAGLAAAGLAEDRLVYMVPKGTAPSGAVSQLILR